MSKVCALSEIDGPCVDGVLSLGLCMKHWQRHKRHGDALYQGKPGRQGQGRLRGSKNTVRGVKSTGQPYLSGRPGKKYLLVFDPDHPLSDDVRGRVPVHRKVLYDIIGPGTHPCHWCQKPVTWGFTGTKSGALIVDHLDGDGTNNKPRNLVPSCHRCNVTRGAVINWLNKHGLSSVKAGLRK